MAIEESSGQIPRTVAITGQSGFIGFHLTNYLLLKGFNVVPVKKIDFLSEEALQTALKNCCTIVHLAGMNRGPEQEVYDCNIRLASQIIHALERDNLSPQVIFASSSQEDTGSIYGQAKRKATDLFVDWATKKNCRFSSLIIPNVFGPFCKPFYNSVVANIQFSINS